MGFCRYVPPYKRQSSGGGMKGSRGGFSSPGRHPQNSGPQTNSAQTQEAVNGAAGNIHSCKPTYIIYKQLHTACWLNYLFL